MIISKAVKVWYVVVVGTPAELNTPKSDSIELQIDRHEQRPWRTTHYPLASPTYISNFLIIEPISNI